MIRSTRLAAGVLAGALVVVIVWTNSASAITLNTISPIAAYQDTLTWSSRAPDGSHLHIRHDGETWDAATRPGAAFDADIGLDINGRLVAVY